VYGIAFFSYLGLSVLTGFETDGWDSLPYFKYRDLPGFESLVVPLVIAVPLIARMLQTAQGAWEERDPTMLFNTFKYLLALLLLTLGAMEPLCSTAFVPQWSPLDEDAAQVLEPYNVPHIRVAWLFVAIVLTLYSAYWDAKFDWGLLTDLKSRRAAGLLRPHLMFYRPWLYYLAISVNVVLRFNWCLSFTPFDWASWQQTVIVPIIVGVELTRRAAWGILSVEYQHVHGRRTKDKEGDREKVENVPIFFEHQETVEESQARYETGTLSSLGKEVLVMLVMVLVLIVLGKVTSLVHIFIPGDVHNPSTKV
jgi:hypothetical protein